MTSVREIHSQATPMKFIDASVFVHAYLKPKRTLTPQEIQIKEDAKRIVRRLNEGEKALTSVVHLAEIANILEDYMPREEALEIEKALCFRDTIEIEPVDRLDCSHALVDAEEKQIGLTDAMAYVLMKRKGVSEIYSFDSDFDSIAEIKRARK